MEDTTIKLKKRTKSALDKFRASGESYDKAIKKLIHSLKRKNLKAQLIEAYQSRGKEELSILEEWEPTSSELSSG